MHARSYYRGAESGPQELYLARQRLTLRALHEKVWHTCMDVPRETARTETSRAPCADSAASRPAAAIAAYTWHRGLRVHAALLHVCYQPSLLLTVPVSWQHAHK